MKKKTQSRNSSTSKEKPELIVTNSISNSKLKPKDQKLNQSHFNHNIKNTINKEKPEK